MPNQRAKDQVLIAFALKADLADGLDRARDIKRQNRSDFIRDAIKSEVERQGIEVPKGANRAPDRVKSRAPNSGLPTTVKEGVEKAVRDVQKRGVVFGRSRKAASPSGKTS